MLLINGYILLLLQRFAWFFFIFPINHLFLNSFSTTRPKACYNKKIKDNIV